MIRIFAFAMLFVGLTAANAAEVQNGTFLNRPILNGQVIDHPVLQTQTGERSGAHNNMVPWIGSTAGKNPGGTACAFCTGNEGGVGWHGN
jgi:hypothetical protein